MKHRHLFWLAPSLLALVAAACGGSDDAPPQINCGPGTEQIGQTCLPVAADGGGGEGGTDATVDLAPTFAGVQSVSPASATSLQITWDAATDALTPPALLKYRIYVGTTKGGQNFSAAQYTTPPGATTFVATGLTTGTEYFVVVRAVNLSGLEDKNTTELSGKPATDEVAPTFGGLKAAETAEGAGVKLSWEAGTDNLTSAKGLTYLVYWSEKPGEQNFGTPGAISPPGVSSFVVKGLPPTTPLHFVVRARDAAGNTDTNKVQVEAKTGADTSPPTFGGCTSTETKNAAAITVSWKPATDDVTPPESIEYRVYGAKKGATIDFTKPLATFTGGKQGDVEGLEAATDYEFVCRAADASGNEDDNKSPRLGRTSADSSPPVFAGLVSATNVTATTVDLAWAAATDDKTPQAEIVYDVFEATTPGGHDFTAAKASSEKGATKMTLTGLSSASTLYWVVRARDLAGNRDTNTVEKSATTQVSYALNIQPIFTLNCATSTCHRGTTPAAALTLVEGLSYASIVSQPATSGPGLIRVKPGDSANSWLYRKIMNTHNIGNLMPPPESFLILTPTEKELIRAWIDQGALNN